MSEKHRTGRPLKQHAAGTLVTITLQVPAELKNRLQAKAVAANRSLSQEAQRRLDRSFSVQTLQEDAVGVVVEETYAQIAKQLEETLSDQKAALEKSAAELRRRVADQIAELEEVTKRSRTK